MLYNIWKMFVHILFKIFLYKRNKHEFLNIFLTPWNFSARKYIVCKNIIHILSYIIGR